MRVTTVARIREAQAKWPYCSTALISWDDQIRLNNPQNFAQMKSIFPATDLVGEFHVFDIGGNKIRLIAGVAYSTQQVFIKHVLNHAQYDRNNWKV